MLSIRTDSMKGETLRRDELHFGGKEYACNAGPEGSEGKGGKVCISWC